MSEFLLSRSWELPALPLCDKFLGDAIASEKGGVINVVDEEKVFLTKESNEDDIKHYFEGVLELAKSDKEFPVDLDDIWMLAYPRKDHAVRALKENFMQSVDYQVFPKNREKSKMGRPIDGYFLTISCMEFFVARKVKAVFEVYRKVFHGAVKMVQQSGVPSYQEEDPIKRAERWIAEQKEKQALMLENKEQRRLLEESNKEIVALSSTITQMQPKVTYFDVMIKNKSTSVITSMAQDYGMSAQAFNKRLNELGIQHKVANQWVLYSKYLDKGYVNSEPVTITHNDGSQTVKYITKWTQRGRFFLYDFLKSRGVFPLIERSPQGEAHQEN